MSQTRHSKGAALLGEKDMLVGRRSLTSHKARNLAKYALVQEAEIERLQEEIKDMVS